MRLDRDFLDQAILAVAASSADLDEAAVVARARDLTLARGAFLETLQREEDERSVVERKEREEHRRAETRRAFEKLGPGDYVSGNLAGFPFAEEVLAERGLALWSCTLVPLAEVQEVLAHEERVEDEHVEQQRTSRSAGEARMAQQALESFANRLTLARKAKDVHPG